MQRVHFLEAELLVQQCSYSQYKRKYLRVEQNRELPPKDRIAKSAHHLTTETIHIDSEEKDALITSCQMHLAEKGVVLPRRLTGGKMVTVGMQLSLKFW